MHAYLIIAHNNPLVLEYLLKAIDDERNDIFIHIDKKSKILNPNHLRTIVTKSKIYFTERTNIYWGDISIVKAELNLFYTARSTKKGYTYYHLISGSDFPLKSQNEIHHFFTQYQGKEFLGYSSAEFNLDRINKVTLFPKYQRLNENDLSKRFLRKLSQFYLKLQRKLNYNKPNPKNTNYKYGSQWVSVSDNFVKKLLLNKEQIIKQYKYSSCPDEIYKQTFAFNSSFKDKIYDINDELNGCQRFMDWNRGAPYTFKEEDFDLLINSDKLFARKFDDTNIVIIEKLSEYIERRT